MHAHAVDTGPFLPRKEGPGDEGSVRVQSISLAFERACLRKRVAYRCVRKLVTHASL